MYDVDGNGVIDQDEMTKIVQVAKYLNKEMIVKNQKYEEKQIWQIELSGDIQH